MRSVELIDLRSDLPEGCPCRVVRPPQRSAGVRVVFGANCLDRTNVGSQVPPQGGSSAADLLDQFQGLQVLGMLRLNLDTSQLSFVHTRDRSPDPDVPTAP